MIQTSSLRTAVFAVSLTLLFCAAALAQQDQPADRNYDVSLHLVVGSNDAGTSRVDVPKDLDGVIRQIKNGFSFSSYRLVSTFIGRVGEAGAFSYQSVANIDGKELASSVPTFLDWSLQDLRGNAATHACKLQQFKLGARVPVAVGGSGENRVSYESIGVSVQRLGVVENTPTLIGTVHLPGTSGTVFVIMTVRPTMG